MSWDAVSLSCHHRFPCIVKKDNEFDQPEAKPLRLFVIDMEACVFVFSQLQTHLTIYIFTAADG